MLLAAGTILLALVHAAAGLLRTGPTIVADESGYLFAARVLAGHGGGPLAGATYYHSGWSLLLTPTELLTSDPRAVFVTGLVLNAALAAAVAPLVHRILRRHLGVPARPAVAAALVSAAYPALHVLSSAALPEALLAVLVLVIALALAELASGGHQTRWGLGLGAALAYAFASHGRSVALVAAAMVAVAALRVRGRVGVRAIAASTTALVVGVLLAVLLDRWVRDAGYDGRPAAQPTRSPSSLADLGTSASAVRNLIGHAWYLAVATLGVLPLLLSRWRDATLRERLAGGGVAAWSSLLMLLGLLAVSAASLSEPTRADHLVYGRYTEAALPLLVGLGVAELLRRRPSRTETAWVAVGLLALTGAVALLRAGFEESAGPNRWNISALPVAPTGALGASVLAGAGVVAVTLVVALRLRLPPSLLGCGFLAVAAYGQLVPVGSAESSVYGEGWLDPAGVVPDGATVGVAPETVDPFGRYAYPWFVPGEIGLTRDADLVFADAAATARRRMDPGLARPVGSGHALPDEVIRGGRPPLGWRCPDPRLLRCSPVRLADQILEHVHLTQRQVAETRWDSKRGDRRTRQWPEAAAVSKITKVTSTCNICGWRERGFEGVSTASPRSARSAARSRATASSTGAGPSARSTTRRPPCSRPRPAWAALPRRMIERVDYTCSDYDLSMHSAMIQLDLQAIDLPDASLDVVLTPHVLEHVPDTDKALSELFRVMKPGGHVFLQVPIPQSVTKVPEEPEYHGDMTLVYFRFGWDLADKIRAHGFECSTLVTEELRDAAAAGTCPWTHEGSDCDVEDLMAGADASTMTVIASTKEAELHGFRPAYQFITFDCHKPA